MFCVQGHIFKMALKPGDKKSGKAPPGSKTPGGSKGSQDGVEVKDFSNDILGEKKDEGNNNDENSSNKNVGNSASSNLVDPASNNNNVVLPAARKLKPFNPLVKVGFLMIPQCLQKVLMFYFINIFYSQPLKVALHNS